MGRVPKTPHKRSLPFLVSDSMLSRSLLWDTSVHQPTLIRVLTKHCGLSGYSALRFRLLWVSVCGLFVFNYSVFVSQHFLACWDVSSDWSKGASVFVCRTLQPKHDKLHDRDNLGLVILSTATIGEVALITRDGTLAGSVPFTKWTTFSMKSTSSQQPSQTTVRNDN